MATANGAPASNMAAGRTSHTLNQLDGLDFEDAVRAAEKARIALTGPSGSGKTYTALSIGTGLLPEGGTLGVIDTERGSASKYAGLFTFKTMKLPSFEPQALIRALAVAAARGIDVVVIDSLTHFWSGRGGALAQVDQKTKNSSSKNAFTTGWKDVSPLLLDMLDAILSYPGHVITTMRVKTEWVIQENDRGKKEPTKVGMKLDQRDGIDYEFDLVGALDQSHVMSVDKSRYPTIEVGSLHDKPDFSFGQTIAQWLDDGEGNALGVMDYARLAVDPEQTPQQLLNLLADAEGRGLLGAAVLDLSRQATSLGTLIRLMGAAARVKDPATDPDGIRALRLRMEQSNQLGLLVPGMDGSPTTLGDLISFVQHQARQQNAQGGDKHNTDPAAGPDPVDQLLAQVQRHWNDSTELTKDMAEAGRRNVVMREVDGPLGGMVKFGEMVTARITELKEKARQAELNGTERSAA
ncbi:ATP-binding protein [Streptomyces sp. NPDC052052]|uniref:ATP-binding protein n=1 Tax=Streptomyces sp. NPDC052052 TaxID=3154756 RepID=UPI00341CE464